MGIVLSYEGFRDLFMRGGVGGVGGVAVVACFSILPKFFWRITLQRLFWRLLHYHTTTPSKTIKRINQCHMFAFSLFIPLLTDFLLTLFMTIQPLALVKARRPLGFRHRRTRMASGLLYHSTMSSVLQTTIVGFNQLVTEHFFRFQSPLIKHCLCVHIMSIVFPILSSQNSFLSL